MGNTLSPMQRDLSGIDNDTARDAMEILNRLEDMAQDRIDLFYERISHSHYDKHLIPINKVLNKHTYITIKEESNDVWASNVKEAVGDFSVGPVADGLASVATNTITKMLGLAVGRRQIEQRYAISVDALGGISRLDYFIFTYTFTSTELSRRSASLIACCVVESSASIEGLDANTLRVIISRAFKGGNVPHSTLTAIYTQMATAIESPTARFSAMSIKEKEELETWYRPGFQQTEVQQTGFQPQGGFQQGGFQQGGFQQGGFQPVPSNDPGFATMSNGNGEITDNGASPNAGSEVAPS